MRGEEEGNCRVSANEVQLYTGAQINSIFNLWLYLGVETTGIVRTGLGQVAGLLADAWGGGGELQGLSQ
jgi:hypothetical protein